jgi:SPP1 gp7 family putative phage head morphogenesis protein
LGINETLRDLAIRHQTYLYRLATGTAAQVNELLRQVEGDLVAQIAKYDPTEASGYSLTRLNKMLAAIKEINAANYQEVRDFLEQNLMDLSKYEAEFQDKQLSGELPADWPLAQPTVKALESIVTTEPIQGRLFGEWMDGLEAGTLDKITQAIRIGLTEGETIDQLAQRLRGTKALQYNDGILGITRRWAESVVRTATSHVTNAAKEAVYEANSDVIDRVQWHATLDTSTCLDCADLDGETWPVGDDHEEPPHHINCRCVIVPVTVSYEDLGIPVSEISAGTRASMNGQVSSSITYPEWLKGQPRSVVNEALGVGKAKLFIDGKLKIGAFTDRTGHAYTLDQLRTREAAAFAKAGLD